MPDQLNQIPIDDEPEPSPYVCGVCRGGSWVLMDDGACICAKCEMEAESLECLSTKPVSVDGKRSTEVVFSTVHGPEGSMDLPGQCGNCDSMLFVLWPDGNVSCFSCEADATRQRHYKEQA